MKAVHLLLPARQSASETVGLQAASRTSSERFGLQDWALPIHSRHCQDYGCCHGYDNDYCDYCCYSCCLCQCWYDCRPCCYNATTVTTTITTPASSTHLLLLPYSYYCCDRNVWLSTMRKDPENSSPRLGPKPNSPAV